MSSNPISQNESSIQNMYKCWIAFLHEYCKIQIARPIPLCFAAAEKFYVTVFPGKR